jgi:hypothetical protein
MVSQSEGDIMKQSAVAVQHSFRQKRFSITAVILFTLAPALGPAAYGQSASSAQAYYGSTQNGVTVADMFSPTLLFSGQLKTANVGSVLAGVSVECVLWTYTSTTATSSGGKNSSSARASVKVTVNVDGHPMVPGQVVYCDRLQALGVTLTTGVATDSITIELFQATRTQIISTFSPGLLAQPSTTSKFGRKSLWTVATIPAP